MQTNHINAEQLADLLTEAVVLDTIEHEGQRTYVLEYTGQDILAVDTLNGGATVIYPCSSFDAESGGSIHDHARSQREG
ncbi:hypothetical protein [Variovorax sp. AFSI2.2]|uniref:hypothetical protein n=1 Tax=Variovorax sp. AFSI2.2 TaxID=3384160 RepID=UPI003EBD2B56